MIYKKSGIPEPILFPAKISGWKKQYSNQFIPFYEIDPELFDFLLFRFSFGETTEEVTRNRKSKSYRTKIISNA